MKPDIHPKYFDAAEIRCSCGNVIVVGSTREHLKTELCSKCHPFYTGQQKLVDTAGRVDKFEAKRKKSAAMAEATKQRLADKKKKPEAYKEKEIPAEVIERAMGEAKPAGKWGGPIGDAPAEIVVKEEVAEAKAEEVKVKKAPAKKPAVKKAPAKKAAAKKKK
ncbi:MAG: 50S ribosomal protein L31 [Candidatus Paceibacterota bacterium]|jgi:large subunit ribosomal protein L31